MAWTEMLSCLYTLPLTAMGLLFSVRVDDPQDCYRFFDDL